jgi:hypothetical protein
MGDLANADVAFFHGQAEHGVGLGAHEVVDGDVLGENERRE